MVVHRKRRATASIEQVQRPSRHPPGEFDRWTVPMPTSRVGELNYAEFLTWDFSSVFKDLSQQCFTNAEVPISPDFELEKLFWPRVSKRRASRVVSAVRKSSADSRVTQITCLERSSLVRIQQLASLACIDLNYVDEGPRDQKRVRIG